MPGSVHSGSANWDDCGRVFPDELRVSSFPDRLPDCLDSGIVRPHRLRWVKGVCVLSCNLPPALLAEWPGSSTCQCGNIGVERTPNMSQRISFFSRHSFVCPTSYWPFIQSFLLKGDPPFCIPCKKSLSLQHVLLHCSDIIDVRKKYFHANSLRMLFRDVSLDLISPDVIPRGWLGLKHQLTY